MEKMDKRIAFFFLLLFFLFFRPDPIPINSDDFWVFNIVHDMVENPSYYSLSGSGYRIVHKLVYLPFFALRGFQVDKLAVIATFITALFSTGMAFLTYKFFSRLWGDTTGIIAAFLIGTSNSMYYTTWYWSSTHLIIGTFFFLAAVYSYYFSTRKILLWSIFAGLAMFTRESFAIPVALISAYIFVRHKEREKYWIIVPLLLFGTYIVLNKIFLGAFINPTFAGKVQFGIENLAREGTYARHVSQTLLLPLLVLCIIFFVINTLKKGLTISHPILILWFSGHVITLLMTANADKRYLIPFMPLVFAFSASQANGILTGYEKKTHVLLIGALLLWHAVFFSRQALYLLSPPAWTFVLHLALYSTLLYSFTLLLQPSVKSAAATVFLVVLLAAALIQLSMTYSFFVYQYDWTTTPNEAVAYLAKTVHPDTIILENKRNSITTPDKDWFVAYGRLDITPVYIAEATSINNTIFWSTPESKMETDETGAKAQELKLEPFKTFGKKEKKYPLLKISSSSEKRWRQFLETGTLFKIEKSPAYKVQLYNDRHK